MPAFETPGRVALDVSNPAGMVVVQPWGEPRVDVEVTPRRGDDVSQQAAAETRVEVVDRGDVRQIVVRVPKREGRLGFLGRSPEVDVSIRCPEGSDMEVATQSADVDARGRLGDVRVRTASGDAVLGDTGSLELTTTSGDLSAGDIGGSLTVKTTSGDVVVRTVSGAAVVTTVSGDVRVGETSQPASVNTVSGDVELEAAAGGTRVTAVSGDVSVATPPGLALWIDVQSVSGAVTSELEVGDAPGTGGRQVELRIRTVSGDVRITRTRAPVA